MNCFICQKSTNLQQTVNEKTQPICTQCVLKQIAAEKEKEEQAKRDERKKKCGCVCTMRRLFDEYVKPLVTEEFEFDHVDHCCKEFGEGNTIQYTTKNVSISYHSVVTWHKGDYDSFVDYSVFVNDKLVKSYDERA